MAKKKEDTPDLANVKKLALAALARLRKGK